MTVISCHYPEIRHCYRDFKRFAFALPRAKRKVKTVRELAALMGFPRGRAKRLANALVKVGAVRRTKGRLVWPDEDVHFSFRLVDLPPDSGFENDVPLAARIERLESIAAAQEAMLEWAQTATAEIIDTGKLHG